MLKQIKTLSLPEGNFPVEVHIFDESDLSKLESLYYNWRRICDDLKTFEARSLNLPEGLSEVAICLKMKWYRVNSVKYSGFNSSFDCYDPINNKRIQVKASSIEEDLSSFGPESVWDILCFLDFYKEGRWDGSFDVYLIKNPDLIYNLVLKKKGNETFRDQQKQGRRPRLSIKKSVIQANNIKPFKTFKI